MKDFLIAVGFIVVAVLIITTFITGNSGSIKSESTRIGNIMVNDMRDIERTRTNP